MIHHRVKAGVLRPLHRGVYLVGPIAPPLAHEIGAVFACGERSYLSHGPSAHVWTLTPYLPKPAMPEVTVVRRDPRPPGIRVHRVGLLDPDETTTYKRIPITTPARTLLDLAPELNPRPTRTLTRRGLSAAPGSTVRTAFPTRPSFRPPRGPGPAAPPRDRPRLHSLRARGALPRPGPPGRPPRARGQRPARPLRDRLPLARGASPCRARRLGLPLRPRGLRDRPPPRRRARRPRLPRRPRHLAPDPRRAGSGRGAACGGARRVRGGVTKRCRAA